MTIAWHVDDLKISHADTTVVTNFIKKLDNKYGYKANCERASLTVNRGLKQDYLEMTLDYSEARKVRVDMREYINKHILLDLPDGFDGDAATPAAPHLFSVNDECTKLDKESSSSFHHVVAQLFFYANECALICK